MLKRAERGGKCSWEICWNKSLRRNNTHKMSSPSKAVRNASNSPLNCRDETQRTEKQYGFRLMPNFRKKITNGWSKHQNARTRTQLNMPRNNSRHESKPKPAISATNTLIHRTQPISESSFYQLKVYMPKFCAEPACRIMLQREFRVTVDRANCLRRFVEQFADGIPHAGD